MFKKLTTLENISVFLKWYTIELLINVYFLEPLKTRLFYWKLYRKKLASPVELTLRPLERKTHTIENILI